MCEGGIREGRDFHKHILRELKSKMTSFIDEFSSKKK